MWNFIRKLFGGQNRSKTTVIEVKIDGQAIVRSVQAAQHRRQRLLNEAPAELPYDSIRTVAVRKAKNPYSLSKYPVFYISGATEQDAIEAFINSNPRAKIISFYVNGAAQDFHPGRDGHSPTYNVATREMKIIFEENRFMEKAIKAWLVAQYNRIKDG